MNSTYTGWLPAQRPASWLWLVSDGAVYFLSNCNTIEKRQRSLIYLILTNIQKHIFFNTASLTIYTKIPKKYFLVFWAWAVFGNKQTKKVKIRRHTLFGFPTSWGSEPLSLAKFLTWWCYSRNLVFIDVVLAPLVWKHFIVPDSAIPSGKPLAGVNVNVRPRNRRVEPAFTHKSNGRQSWNVQKQFLKLVKTLLGNCYVALTQTATVGFVCRSALKSFSAQHKDTVRGPTANSCSLLIFCSQKNVRSCCHIHTSFANKPPKLFCQFNSFLNLEMISSLYGAVLLNRWKSTRLLSVNAVMWERFVTQDEITKLKVPASPLNPTKTTKQISFFLLSNILNIQYFQLFTNKSANVLPFPFFAHSCFFAEFKSKGKNIITYNIKLNHMLF